MAELGKKDLQVAINECIEEQQPFVFYRLPDNNEVHLIAESKLGKEKLTEAPGFIICPFQKSESAETRFIRKDKHYAGQVTDFSGLQLNIKDICGSESANTKATKEEFCGYVEKAVKNIRKGKFDKVILSRVEKANVTESNPLQIFLGLCRKYTSAFVSLVVIPSKTVWLTASPELLMSLQGDTIKTVSLAGTKPANTSIPWGEKEKMEQQMVTDYIYSALALNCIDVQANGSFETIAGTVAHLKTEFTGTLHTGMFHLLADLHPTPAICGLPRDKALAFIIETEPHKRKYYTGYLGPCNMNGKTEWYVNLRCAELFPGRANLFVGGGITADSVPEKEWNETIMKAQTLLAVIAPTLKVV